MLHNTSLSVSDFPANCLRSVLIVEDDALIRLCLTEYLQECGYDVQQAVDAQEAKQMLTEKPFALVFSDVNMPGGETGFGLEKWIRRHCPNTSVLLTSGFPQEAAATSGLSTPLITKPYNLRSVLQHIQSILAVT